MSTNLTTLEKQLEAIGKLPNYQTPAQRLFLNSVRRCRALGIIRKDKLV